MSLYDTGIRPVVDGHIAKLAEEKRDYGLYWSASSAGYCMRKNLFERLKVPYTSEDARKQRIFSSGDIFHEWIQGITKESGLSIAQELELQDEELMIRGHVDDLVLIKKPYYDQVAEENGSMIAIDFKTKLILYDYKTAHSKWFEYAKNKPVSHYNRMQVGTYMYMLRIKGKTHKYRKAGFPKYDGKTFNYEDYDLRDLSEARVLKISKDDLRLFEYQILWTPELEKEVVGYWSTINGYWRDKKFPKCTCADYENGFMAREKFNPYFYKGEPCSMEWYKEWITNKETE